MTLSNHELFSIRVSCEMTKLYSRYSPNLSTVISWAAGRERGSSPIRFTALTLNKMYLVSEAARGLGLRNGPFSRHYLQIYTEVWENTKTKVFDNARIKHITEHATYYSYWELDLPRVINKIKDSVDNFRISDGSFPGFSMGMALQIPQVY